MTTVAGIGFGCTFHRSDMAGSPTFAAIGEVIDPGSNTITRDTVEATHTASTNRYREYIGGLRDGGEFTAVIALEPGVSSHTNMVADLNSNSARNYRFVFNDATPRKWDFSAFLTSIAQATPIDDRMTLSLTFKVTGQPVLS